MLKKTTIGKQLENVWSGNAASAPLNVSFQANGGFNTKVFGKTTGGVIGVVYNKTNRFLKLVNRRNPYSGTAFSLESDYNDDKYAQDVSWGALGNLAIQLNRLNKISLKSIFNINTTNYITQRTGYDIARGDDLYGSEITFKQNTFFTSQLTGEHSIATPLKLKWYGSFTILDGYIPDQRRLLYSKTKDSQDPFLLLIGNSLSQQSGSRIFQNLSDYIYTAGGDLSYNFNLFSQKQTLKGGYMFQVKDRLYDARLLQIICLPIIQL